MSEILPFPSHCAEQILFFLIQEGELCVNDFITRLNFSLTAIRNNINKLERTKLISRIVDEEKNVFFKNVDLIKSEKLIFASLNYRN